MHETTARLLAAIYAAEGLTGEPAATQAAADALGVSLQRLTNWLERGVSRDGILLANRLLHINQAWVEAGTGEMVTKPATNDLHRSYMVTPPNLGVAQRLILDGQTVLILSRDQVMSEVDQDLFAHAVPDEAVEGQLERGALVVWQRSRAPRFGRPVLVRVGDELHVRLYEQGRAPGQWIARATRAGFASFDSSTDQAVIVAALRGMLEPD